MRKIAILTFTTLDGVMQAPSVPDEDRSGGFEHGGWAKPDWDPVMEHVSREAMATPYDVLLGRKTYELFAANFPDAGDEHPMNTAKKFVVTSTLNHLTWNNSTRVSGDIPTEIARLKAQDGPLMQVHGSAELIRTLLAHDLVDELRLWIFPVVVGAGKRLFYPDAKAGRFTLVKTEAGPTGVVMCIYRRG
ncbi:MAG: dihydrofolate reductase family protein [Polyangiales bacterium]